MKKTPDLFSDSSAMLPDPGLEPTDIPEAKIMAVLLTWSRLDTAKTLVALRRERQATPEFEAIVALARGPELATSPGRNGLEEPRAWAALELAMLALQRGDRTAARKWLNESASWSKEAELERKRLEAEFRRS